MAFSKTDIINRALVKLGARPIVNLDTDNTDESETALNIYDIALETLLSEALWTFATRRVLLATLSQTIPFITNREAGTTLVYQRPNDVVRIFATNNTAAYYQEEEETIISDTAGLGIIYTYRNITTSTYRPYFARALSDLLAAEMSYPILNSRSKTDDLFGFYENISLPAAMAQNSQVGTPIPMEDGYWEAGRIGGPNVSGHS